jgi:hypothetical protein
MPAAANNDHSATCALKADHRASTHKASLIGAGLPNVRYALVAIKFRTAAKRRDGPVADVKQFYSAAFCQSGVCL